MTGFGLVIFGMLLGQALPLAALALKEGVTDELRKWLRRYAIFTGIVFGVAIWAYLDHNLTLRQCASLIRDMGQFFHFPR